MATGKIKLYMRVALSTGKWAYVPAAYSGKGKIRPEYALIDGKAEHHPEGVYALRFADGAKRVWQSVGPGGVLALTRLQQMQLHSNAEALGIEVNYADFFLSPVRRVRLVQSGNILKPGDAWKPLNRLHESVCSHVNDV